MLSELQKEHSEWQRRNFPNAEKWECLVGLQEELGELSHAFLKQHQGIRTEEDHERKIKDSVGDIAIFLMGFCTHNGLDIDECIDSAWSEVKRREWNSGTKGVQRE